MFSNKKEVKMNINNNNSNVNFQAKFFKNDDLTSIVKYAQEHGKFDKLNKARKEIDNNYQTLRTRLKVDICYTDNYPTVIFSRYQPQKDCIALSGKDYELTAQTEFICPKKGQNPLKFALDRIIKLSQGAPESKMYKKVVIDKGEIIDPYL